MNAPKKTVVVFIGLPYTGKTTLIQYLQADYAGKAIYADELFTRATPPAQITLRRWLQEGCNLTARIQAIVQQSTQERFFVELGTMQAKPRAKFIRWCRERGYKVIPVWCRCRNQTALQQRHRARIAKIGAGRAKGAKIDITLDDLYQRICAAFEEPDPAEGFTKISTCRPMNETLAAIACLLQETRK